VVSLGSSFSACSSCCRSSPSCRTSPPLPPPLQGSRFFSAPARRPFPPSPPRTSEARLRRLGRSAAQRESAMALAPAACLLNGTANLCMAASPRRTSRETASTRPPPTFALASPRLICLPPSLVQFIFFVCYFRVLSWGESNLAAFPRPSEVHRISASETSSLIARVPRSRLVPRIGLLLAATSPRTRSRRRPSLRFPQAIPPPGRLIPWQTNTRSISIL